MSSRAWKLLRKMCALLARFPSVHFDQCVLGLQSEARLLKKRTKIVTNSQSLVYLLRQQQCKFAEPHQHVLCMYGPRVTERAGRYPLALLRLIICAAKDEHTRRHWASEFPCCTAEGTMEQDAVDELFGNGGFYADADSVANADEDSGASDIEPDMEAEGVTASFSKPDLERFHRALMRMHVNSGHRAFKARFEDQRRGAPSDRSLPIDELHRLPGAGADEAAAAGDLAQGTLPGRRRPHRPAAGRRRE